MISMAAEEKLHLFRQLGQSLRFEKRHRDLLQSINLMGEVLEALGMDGVGPPIKPHIHFGTVNGEIVVYDFAHPASVPFEEVCTFADNWLGKSNWEYLGVGQWHNEDVPESFKFAPEAR